MLLRIKEQVTYFSNFADLNDKNIDIMEYHELPTLILFENKNDKNKIKKKVFDPNLNKTEHTKENSASKTRPFTLFCRVIC